MPITGRRDAVSSYSVDDMFRYARDVSPDCMVFTSDSETGRLLELLSKDRALCKSSMSSDVIIKGHIRYLNCEINQSYQNNGETKWDRHRIIIFPDYREIINKRPGKSVIIGFAHFLYNRTLSCIVPLAFIAKKHPYITHGDVFVKNKADAAPEIMRGRTAGAVRNIIYCVMPTWGVVQNASADPHSESLLIFSNTKKNTTCKINSGKIEEMLTALS